MPSLMPRYSTSTRPTETVTLLMVRPLAAANCSALARVWICTAMGFTASPVAAAT